MFKSIIVCFSVFLLFTSVTTAQIQQCENKFIYGVYLDMVDSTNQAVYDSVDNLKMNTVVQYANFNDSNQWGYLSKYTVIASRSVDSTTDFVNYYSSGYYTKWEAEDVTSNSGTGFRANYGGSTVYDNRNCWTTGSETSHSGELMLHGPYYRQDKKYKLLYLQDSINYEVHFEIAKTNLIPLNPLPEDSICRIAVVFTYLDDKGDSISLTLSSRTFYDSSFSSDEFHSFSLNYNYPQDFRQTIEKTTFMGSENPLSFNDTKNGTGIEFQVTWYGKRQIFIDFFEVYDGKIGSRIAGNEQDVKNNVKQFVDSYSSPWNIKYFFTISEPQTIDHYTPMKIVEEALREKGKIGISEFYPQWSGMRNGDWTIEKYKNMINPQRMNVEFISYGIEPQPVIENNQQHARLQEAWETDNDFWYEAMIGTPYHEKWTEPCFLRYPTNAEMNYSLMMALAHGAKGVLVWKLIVSNDKKEEVNCEGDLVYYRVLMDRNGNTLIPDLLYYYYRDYFGPRITGVIGDTLLNLNYTGDFSNYINGGTSPAESSGSNYITFTKYPPPSGDEIYYFHAGLLSHKQNPLDNYFLALNAAPYSRNITINLEPPVSGYNNIRFRNIEGGIDTTFNQSFAYNLTFPAGEGYLYQVSPVVKYGGKLIFSEMITSSDTLRDKLIIYSGDTLKVQSTYTIFDTIVIKSGATFYLDEGAVLNLSDNGNIEVQSGGLFVIKEGAELNFNNSLPLSVKGTLSAQGVYGDSVIFTRGGSTGTWGSIRFDGSSSSNSILNYVKVTYASDIQCLNSANVTIQNSRIQNCTEGIYIYNSEPKIYSNHIIDPLHNGINASGSGYEVEILDNTIMRQSNNSQYQQYQGIYMQNSLEGYIGHNDISGFYWGMYIGGGCTGYFLDINLYTLYPNNRIVYCKKGVGVGWGSELFGGLTEIGGYNTIMNNAWNDLYVYQSSTAWAEFNYWGGGKGNNYADGTSYIDDDVYLDEDPWEESYQLLASGTTNNEQINGLQLEHGSNITTAVDYYKQMIVRNSHPKFALTRLAVLRKKHNLNNLQIYLANLLNGNSPFKPVVMNLLAGLSLNGGNYNQAINLYNTIIQNYPSSYHSVNALFEKFFAALNYAKDDSTASQILSQIEALNLNDEEYLMRLASAVDLLDRFNGSQDLHKSNYSSKNTADGNLPREYKLYQNYPNPFNPETTISYDIPDDAKVSLIIYDILGRKVTSLMNEYKIAGRYQVHFNASSLASGIYIYRIQAGEYTASRKMILIK